MADAAARGGNLDELRRPHRSESTGRTTRRSTGSCSDALRGRSKRRSSARRRPAAERELADEFGVSRITVRKALDGLVADGLLTRRQGAGTFVSGRVEKNFAKLTSFSEDMTARGRTRAASG